MIICQKNSKKIEQLYQEESSGNLEKTSMPLIHLLEMEEDLKKINLVINENEIDVKRISEKLQPISEGQKLSYCYIYLKKIIPNYQGTKELIVQLSISQNSLQPAISLQKFESISFLVTTILKLLQSIPLKQQNEVLLKSLYFDITNMYLKSLKSCLKSNFGQVIPEISVEQYNTGEYLIKQSLLIFSDEEIDNMWKAIYDFRVITLVYFNVINSEKELIFAIIENFINFNFRNEGQLWNLFRHELDIKYHFLDYIYKYSNSDLFKFMFEKIVELTNRFPNNFLILDIRWNYFLQAMKNIDLMNTWQDILEEEIGEQYKWQEALTKLILNDKRRMLSILKKISHFWISPSNEIQKISNTWTKNIFELLIKPFALFLKQSHSEEDCLWLSGDHSKKMVLIEMLFVIQNDDKLRYAKKDLFVTMLTYLIEAMFSWRGKTQQEYIQKKVLTLILITEKIIDYSIIAQFIFSHWGASIFLDDQKQTIDFIFKCRLSPSFSIINLVIFCKLIQGCTKEYGVNFPALDKIYSIFSSLSEMLINEELTESQEFREDFIINQVRLMFRTCLSCYKNKEQYLASPRKLSDQNSQFIYFYYPLINLDVDIQDLNDYTPQPQKNEWHTMDTIIVFLQKIVLLLKKLPSIKDYQLYDIVICAIKLVYFHLKVINPINEIREPIMNNIVNQTEEIIYWMTVQFLSKTHSNLTQKSEKQINNILSGLLRIANENQDFAEMKLTFRNQKVIVNWKFLQILVSVIFECELSISIKQQICNKLKNAVQTNTNFLIQFSTILDKFILLLSLQSDLTEKEFQIKQDMISIIQTTIKSKFTVPQFNQLVRLCLANTEKSLIFTNLKAELQQQLKPLQEQLVQSQTINIFNTSQFSLIEKYNFQSILRSILQLFTESIKKIQKNNGKNRQFLLFKEINSNISLSTNIRINKGFTLCFELKFCQYQYQDDKQTFLNGVIISEIQLEQSLSEFATFYLNCSKDSCEGIQILISSNQVKLRYFRLYQDSDSLRSLVEIQNQAFYIPNNNSFIHSSKCCYQINYELDNTFGVVINGVQCKSRGDKLKCLITSLTRVDLGKSVQDNCNWTFIFSTMAFELQEISFQGKLFQFSFYDKALSQSDFSKKKSLKHLRLQLGQQPSSFQDQKCIGYFIHNDQDVVFYQYLKEENEQPALIKNIYPQTKFISLVNKGAMINIFKIQKVETALLLILDEIQNSKGPYAQEVQEFLTLLLNQVIVLDNILMEQFFNNLPYFNEILSAITQNYQLPALLPIIEIFLRYLLTQNQENYLKQFLEQIVLQFSIFQSQLQTDQHKKMYFIEILCTYQPSLEATISSIKIANDQKVFLNIWFYQFFSEILFQQLKTKQKGGNLSKEQLWQLFLHNGKLLIKLFSYQQFNNEYFSILKRYFEAITSQFQSLFSSALRKYSSQLLISNTAKPDYLNITGLLQAIFNNLNQNQECYWNFVHLLYYLEDLHQQIIQAPQHQIASLTQQILQRREDSQYQELSQVECCKIESILSDLHSLTMKCSLIGIILILQVDQKDDIKILLLCIISRVGQQGLFEIQNNSNIDNLLDSIVLSNANPEIQELYQKMLLNRIQNNVLSDENLARLLNILQINPMFYSTVLESTLKTIRESQKNIAIHNHINLIHILQLLELECFHDFYNQKLKERYSFLLSDCMDYFFRKNFFYFVDKQKIEEVSQINKMQYLPSGALFRLFSSIIIIGATRKCQEVVLVLAIQLLEIYGDALKKQSIDDTYINQVFAYFQCKRDPNSIAFPFITQLFQKEFEGAPEHLGNQYKKLQSLIKQCQGTIDKYLEKNKIIIKEKEQIVQQFQKQQQKIFEYQGELVQKKQTKYSSNICIENTSDELNSTRHTTQNTRNSCQLEDLCQVSFRQKKNKLNYNQYYRIFYFHHKLQNQTEQYKNLREILELSLNQYCTQLPNSCKIKYQCTMMLDYENRIVLCQSASEEHRMLQQSDLLDSCNNESSDIQASKAEEAVSALSKSNYGSGEVQFINVEQKYNSPDLFSMIDQENGNNVSLKASDTTVCILKSLSQEKSMLIRKAELNYIKQYFLVFDNENILKKAVKYCKKRDIFCSNDPIQDYKHIITQRWQQGQLSNYQYIFLLNYYAGRNLLDQNNYYIFPWITTKFNEISLEPDRDLSKCHSFSSQQQNYRYFSNNNQMQIFMKGYQSESEELSLIEFLRNLSNNGEALPELYSNPQLFRNFSFPQWVPTNTSEEFIYIMRASLEQKKCQEHLEKWINIIFGILPQCQVTRKKEQISCPYYDELNRMQQDNKKNQHFIDQFMSKNGQLPKQIFTKMHPQKQQICPLFQNQPQWDLNIKKQILDGNDKVISIYYSPYNYLFIITENGNSYVIDTKSRLINILIDCTVSAVQQKSLQTINKLNQNLIVYMDSEKYNFTDNQESQYHFIEHESIQLFSKSTVSVIVAGYQKGEFHIFQGSSLKLVQICKTHNKNDISCLKYCQYRATLIIGQSDSQIGLWKIDKSFEIDSEPYCIIRSHNAPIINIDYSASKILSIDSINEAQVHLYDGQLIQVIILDTIGKITYCSISYTMNLYIFIDSFNQLMAYTLEGGKYIEPIEFLSQIQTVVPLTPFCSQFMYTTDKDIYFNDIFNLRMQQTGRPLDEQQQSRVYNYSFFNSKALNNGRLISNDNKESKISASAIAYLQASDCYSYFVFIGCDDGKVWCTYNEDIETLYFKQKLQKSGLVQQD